MSLAVDLITPIPRAIVSSIAGGWSPLDLFQLGIVGAWWDDSDISTLWADASRTIPASVNGEVLGQTDKSGSGNHRTGTASTGPILRQRADGHCYLDYAGAKTLQVPSSQSLFKYLHDGTGGSVALFVTPPAAGAGVELLRSCGSTSSAGIAIERASNKSLYSTIYRAAAGTTAATSSTNSTSARGCLNANVPRFVGVSYKNDGAASDLSMFLDRSVETHSSATANTPSSANAAESLRVPVSFGGFGHETVIVNRKLAQWEMQAVSSYMLRHEQSIPTVDLVIAVGGQSNASGRGLLTSAALESVSGAYMLDKSEALRLAFEPAHMLSNQLVPTSPTEPSPESPGSSFVLAMGRELNTAGHTSIAVPCAIGSTGAAAWDHPESAGDRTTLFGALCSRYRAALAYSPSAQPVIVWSGHEANASDAVPNYTAGGVGTTYTDALVSLFESIRGELGNIPIVIVQLSADDTLTTSEQQAAAGEAQRQIENTMTDVYLVVAHDVARNASPDDQHISRAGNDVVGARIALAIREHVMAESVNGTGPRPVSASYSGSTVTVTCDKAVNATAGTYGNLFRVYDNGVEATVSSANRGTNTSTIDIVCSSALSGPVTVTYGYRAGIASAARTDFVADADGLPLPTFGPLIASA